MIEFPEALTLARQMNETIRGKRIDYAVRGNVSHKFPFYTHTADEYAEILAGKTLGEARAEGSLILLNVDSDYTLAFGDGGEKIIFHTSEKTLPKKHHFLLRFEDGTYLTVTVQGWGAIRLIANCGLAEDYFIQRIKVSPLSAEFTLDYFLDLFTDEGLQNRSIKYFMISEPGIGGVGNGMLQDILFHAKLHPRRKIKEITDGERETLYYAIVDTLRRAAEQGGRDTETDLFNQRGRYAKVLDNTSVGKPCPECGTPIEKGNFLGGAVYVCPNCQM